MKNISQIWHCIAETPQISVSGNSRFKNKVRRAITNIASTHAHFETSFSGRFIVSSQRIHFDNELFILYLDHSLNGNQIQKVLLQIHNHGSVDEAQVPQTHKLGWFSKISRQFLRKSIEKQIEDAAVRIAQLPPRGNVATEDQHFLMVMMQLKMFVRKISRKIENNSIIWLLESNRRIHQKRLRELHRRRIDGDQSLNPLQEQKTIAEIDALIHEKRLLLQRRLINRSLKGIEKWQNSGNTEAPSQIKLDKVRDLQQEIQNLEHKYDRSKSTTNSVVNNIQKTFLKRRLTRLQRKVIKLNYRTRCNSKQQEFLNKLHLYFQEYYHTSLIPNSFIETINLHIFNALRYLLNLLFIGCYLYLIKIPLPLFPIFLILGMFVFQPVSNKFAVLMMLPFIKTNGLKRLSFSELKQAIEDRASSNNYLCAIDLPLYTGKTSELDTTKHYIHRNLVNLQDTLSYYEKLSVIYQITSNTTDPSLINKEIELTKRAQHRADQLLGNHRVFFIYLHRKSSTAKKVGNILAAHLLKFRGLTDAQIYTDSKKFLTTFPDGPLFDLVHGNFADSLCAVDHNISKQQIDNDTIISMILKGQKIPIHQHVDFTFFIDNKNEIKPSSFEKGLAIMLHPENTNLCILQPEMSIEDPIHEGQKLTSIFLRMMRIARDTHNFRYLKSLHGIFQNMSAYYGKGMIRLEHYDYMVMNEVLNLRYVDSHDWQESVFNYAVFCASSDKRVSVNHVSKNEMTMLLETESDSQMYNMVFADDRCKISDHGGNHRIIHLLPGSEQGQIWQVVDFLDNNIEVGERELISTIGNYIRDTRWLKGDLQMLNTFFPYARYMPAYHKFHLTNIFRRFTNELTLLLWVTVNFIALSLYSSPEQLEAHVLYLLSLHLTVTAFGFAGIDLFLYPISFEIKNNIFGIPRNYVKSTLASIAKIIRKLAIGLWQFPLYLLVAWPRIFLSGFASTKILLAGIDQPVQWKKASNASISSDEVSDKGISMTSFIKCYLAVILTGVLLLSILLLLITTKSAPPSILRLINMGIIVISLILGPFVSYAISKKIEIN